MRGKSRVQVSRIWWCLKIIISFRYLTLALLSSSKILADLVLLRRRLFLRPRVSLRCLSYNTWQQNVLLFLLSEVLFWSHLPIILTNLLKGYFLLYTWLCKRAISSCMILIRSSTVDPSCSVEALITLSQEALINWKKYGNTIKMHKNHAIPKAFTTELALCISSC